MTGWYKGCVLGLLAGIAITFAWASAVTDREGDCLDQRGWPDGCQCEPVPAGTWGVAGIVAIIPGAVIAGGVLGAAARRIRVQRTFAFAMIAAGLALVVTTAASVFTRCSSDPMPPELFVRALIPALAAALALERLTRPDEDATARLVRR